MRRQLKTRGMENYMTQYIVTGMTCAACSSRVEKAVSKVPGVKSCSVNLLTNSMGVEGTASDADVIAAVKNTGYGAAVNRSEKNARSQCTAFKKERMQIKLYQEIAKKNQEADGILIGASNGLSIAEG